MNKKKRVLKLGHSPDPDDAFMWWALTPDKVGKAPLEFAHFSFEPVHSDIESLNERSLIADLEITAISCAQYPYVADKYAITSCGASFGKNYGPKLVTCKDMSLEEVKSSDFKIAVPGARTTASLVTSLMLGCTSDRLVPVPFDETIDRVENGEFQAGVVIHEGQLTFQDARLLLVADLGVWWHDEFTLPLPLGLNVIRRDICKDMEGLGLSDIADALYQSIQHAMNNRMEAIEYSLKFGRGISHDVANEFVEMYVNPLTENCGQQGLKAIEILLIEAFKAGHSPDPGEIDIIEPALNKAKL